MLLKDPYTITMDSIEIVIDVLRKLGMDPEQNVNDIKKCIGKLQTIKNMENKKIYTNHKKPWTKEDNSLLLYLFKRNDKIEYYPNTLKRTQRAIEYQLSKLLIIEVEMTSIDKVAAKYKKTVGDIRMFIDTLHKRQ